jgi:Zn-dependent protease
MNESGNITIGHVWGIPIRINPSMFLILGLLTWSLASNLLPMAYPEMSDAGRWLTALVTAVIFLASILFHELAHAYVARRNGIPVQSVTLYIFGGIAQLGGKAKSPGVEFAVAAAGPVSSFFLAAIFYSVNQVVADRSYLGASTWWLTSINIVLGLFNLLPGYPLDGGRILESVVWAITREQSTAVRIAAGAGQVIAFGLMALGALQILRGDLFSGIWTIAIGLILRSAAIAERQAFLQQSQLAGTPVSRVMGIVQEPSVPSGLSVQQLVEQHILGQGQGSFIVTADGNPVGVLTLRDVTRVPRPEWAQTTTGDIMTPLVELPRVRPQDELLSAIQLMDANQLLHVPVFENGRLAGLLTRDEVIRHLRLRAETAA